MAGLRHDRAMPVIEPGLGNPFVDGRQSPSALMIRAGVERHLAHHRHATLPEFTLKTGRRADLMCLSAKGEFIIVEIKSSIEDFRVDSKWPEYRDFCDRFYFATHVDVPAEIFPQSEGLIIADRFGAEIVRPAEALKLGAATRRALTLRFARQAALRMASLSHHAERAGLTLPDEPDAAEV
jgi:hypothetical protein